MIRATFLFVFLVTSPSIFLNAQGSVAVDENDRVTLHGNVHPSARPQYDVGRTDPSLRMRRMTLLLVPSKPPKRNLRRQPAGGTGFGVSDQKLRAATSWFQSHGFAIERTRVGNSSVNFSGTVAQVEEAFRVEIHDYLIDGKTYYANADRASIPSALSGVIVAVNALDDFPASANVLGETVLHNFTGTLYQPASGGIMDSAGNLYGTTAGGGTTGLGTVFKLDTKGNETVLYSFADANANGASPNAGLVTDSAGNLYGTTLYGGTGGCAYNFGCGTVFKLDTAGNETVLYSFTDANGDGESPYAGPVMDSAGNLYGTTLYGGGNTGAIECIFGCGTVFKVDTTGHETVLHSFTGALAVQLDGAFPYGGLIIDNAGNLYGTTLYGGTYGCVFDSGCGTVFKVDPAGHETVLYSFEGSLVFGGGDGTEPQAGLIMDSAGNLYGTTSYGGADDCGDGDGCGTVFKLDPTGHETVLYSFVGTSTAQSDGLKPQASLILDNTGNLYGTTFYGGTNSCSFNGCGTVFKVDVTGHETVLYNFSGSNGMGPNTGLITDGAGNFYGTTLSGGSASGGIFFKLDPTGHETLLYSFPATNGDGAGSEAGLIMDSSGNLHGTTAFGGSDPYGEFCSLGTAPISLFGPFSSCGTVFTVDATGHETVVYNFTDANGDGAGSGGGLIMDSAGNFYGTTLDGGASGEGTVFKLDTNGHEAVLYSFGLIPDGAGPQASLVMDNAGNLYGTTVFGGSLDTGTVFKLDPTGQETVLYSFDGTVGGQTDGEFPYAGLIIDSAGNLYGTTVYGGSANNGTVFKLDTTGHETILHNFTGANGDGGWPYASLIMDSAGNLYGTTTFFGADLEGTVFKLDTAGHETTLYSFTGANDGGQPYAGLIMDGAGNLYGASLKGGSAGYGTVFKLDTTGHETVLYNIESEAVVSGLIMDAAGNLYGTSSLGGSADVGDVFELTPLLTGTVTVMPSSSSITTVQALSVAVAVAGESGSPTPTGTVTVSSSSYNSPAATLSGGSATINIPAGSLPVGTDTLTASYSGDDRYGAASGTSSVAVTAAQTPPFTIAGTAVSVSPGATSGNASTITLTPQGGFTGNVTLTAAITSSPVGAQDLPTLSFGSSSPVSITSGSAGTATLTISITAATSALAYPVSPGVNGYAALASGTMLLAFAMFSGMGLPARRRRWQTNIGVVVFLAALTGGLLACGGGSSSGSGNSGTTPGTYTVTVTGTSGSLTATGTVTLTVQ
jgi:uncharacterized repeat protein (TIGR03803 family)